MQCNTHTHCGSWGLDMPSTTHWIEGWSESSIASCLNVCVCLYTSVSYILTWRNNLWHLSAAPEEKGSYIYIYIQNGGTSEYAVKFECCYFFIYSIKANDYTCYFCYLFFILKYKWNINLFQLLNVKIYT